MIEVSICRTCGQIGRILNNFGECQDCTKKRAAPEQEKLAVLWEIVREVAKNSDTVINDFDHYECPFCHEEDSRDNEFKVTHKDTCIVTKARALVDNKEQENHGSD